MFFHIYISTDLKLVTFSSPDWATSSRFHDHQILIGPPRFHDSSPFASARRLTPRRLAACLSTSAVVEAQEKLPYSISHAPKREAEHVTVGQEALGHALMPGQ